MWMWNRLVLSFSFWDSNSIYAYSNRTNGSRYYDRETFLYSCISFYCYYQYYSSKSHNRRGRYKCMCFFDRDCLISILLCYRLIYYTNNNNIVTATSNKGSEALCNNLCGHRNLRLYSISISHYSSADTGVRVTWISFSGRKKYTLYWKNISRLYWRNACWDNKYKPLKGTPFTDVNFNLCAG